MKLDPKTQQKLHEGLGEALLELLHGTACETCGRTAPGAKELTVIRQFLADNGTTADLKNQAPIHRLTEDLPHFEDPESPVSRPSKKKRTA